MSVRLLLSVIVAGALIAAAMPVIETAQRTQAENDLSLAVESLESATEKLVRHNDPVRMGIPPATRRVSISLPPQPETATLTIRPPESGIPSNRTVVETNVPGSPPSLTFLNATVRPRSTADAGSLNGTLTVSESTDLTLRYRRVDGTPVITVDRGFK